MVDEAERREISRHEASGPPSRLRATSGVPLSADIAVLLKAWVPILATNAKAEWLALLNCSKGQAAVVESYGPVPIGLAGATLDDFVLNADDALQLFLATTGQTEAKNVHAVVVQSGRSNGTGVSLPPPDVLLVGAASGPDAKVAELARTLGAELGVSRDAAATDALREFTRVAARTWKIDEVQDLLLRAFDSAGFRIWVPSVGPQRDVEPSLELWWATTPGELRHFQRVLPSEPSFAYEVFRRNHVLIAPDTCDPQLAEHIQVSVLELSGAESRSHQVTVSSFPGAVDKSLLGIPVSYPGGTQAVVVFAARNSFVYQPHRVAYLAEHLVPILGPLISRLLLAQQNDLVARLRSSLARRLHADKGGDALAGFAAGFGEACSSVGKCRVLIGEDPTNAVSCGIADNTIPTELIEQCRATQRIVSGGIDLPEGFAGVRLYPLSVKYGTTGGQRMPIVVCTVFDCHPFAAMADKEFLERVQAQVDEYMHLFCANEQVELAEALREEFENTSSPSAFYEKALKLSGRLLQARCSLWTMKSGKPNLYLPDDASVPDRSARVSRAESSGLPQIGTKTLALPVPQRHGADWFLVADREDGSRPFCAFDLQRAERFCTQVVVFARATRAILDRDEVIATVPHELRVPISAIADALLGLGRAQLPPPILDALGTIEKANELSDLLIHNLLSATGMSLSNEESKEWLRLKADVLVPVLNLVRLVGDQALLARDAIHLDDSQIPEFCCDRMAVMSVFYNLLWNAVKYHKPGREGFDVRVHSERSPTSDGWLVHVTDYGIGVPAGWEQSIFLRGKRAPNARRSKKVGLGLGLPVALSMANSWGGDLVLTKSEQPTIFTVSFPKALFQR